MNQQLIDLSYEWWIKLTPLCKKFARETYLCGYHEDDLMQECYLQLLKCLEKYDASLGVPFASYYKIQLYGWRANQNRKKTDHLSQVADLEDEITQIADETVNIELQTQNKILLEQNLQVLKHMKVNDQALVIGYYLQHRSLKDLAEELGIKYKSAEYKKTQAIKYLKSILML